MSERREDDDNASRSSLGRSIGSEQGSLGGETPVIGAPPSYLSEGETPLTYTRGLPARATPVVYMTPRIPSAISGRGSAGATPYPRIQSGYTTPHTQRYSSGADVATSRIQNVRSGRGRAERPRTPASTTNRPDEIRPERVVEFQPQQGTQEQVVTLSQEHYDYLVQWTRRGLDAETRNLEIGRRVGEGQQGLAGVSVRPTELAVTPRETEGRETQRMSYPDEASRD